MPDLGTRLRGYIDAAADPVTLDEVTELRVETAPRRSLRWLGVAAAVLAVVAVTAVVAAVSPDHGEKVSTAPPRSDQWLTPFGAESPMPAIPAGWKVLDYEDIRFAVPRDWTVPISGGCAGHEVLVDQAPGARHCFNMTEPWTGVVIQHRADLRGPSPYLRRFGDGWTATATGPLAPQITGTFTDSGQRRALESGPVASTDGWREVAFDGVAVQVPPTWRTAPGSSPNPGDCGQGMFPIGASPQVFVGEKPGARFCPAIIARPLDAVGQGVWIRPAAGELSEMRHPLTTGVIDGQRVAIGRAPGRYRDPALDLLVDTGTRQVRISIGVGLDASVARAILRSIHGV